MSLALIQSLLWNPLSFLWIGCVIVLLVHGKRMSRPSFKLRKLLKSENGAAYSMSLALLTPLYTLMVCLLIELTLMLNVQIGVDYAAYSAARAAIVWLPAEVTPFNTRQQLVHMVHLAAAQALTPYASSLDKHHRSNGNPDPAGDEGYLTAYNALVTTGTHQQASYVQSKRQYAMAATRVKFDPPLEALLGPVSSPAPEVKVTVNYEMPFNTPGVGMILGRKSSSGIGYVRDLTSTVTLQLERPKTKNGSLGFEYDSRPAGGEDPETSDRPVPTGVGVVAGGYEGSSGGLFGNEWDAARRLAASLKGGVERLSDRPDMSGIGHLVLSAHGVIWGENGPRIWFPSTDGSNIHFNPTELAAFLRDLHFRGSKITLVICNSRRTGPQGEPSFAEQLKQQMDTTVIGYAHYVSIASVSGEVVKYVGGAPWPKTLREWRYVVWRILFLQPTTEAAEPTDTDKVH
ncbi:MAG: hypothetical protein KDB01_01050 [Planctomycetaceae bacterium]|nr:hypothetical protein [Planctomycetaceae bacterium]